MIKENIIMIDFCKDYNWEFIQSLIRTTRQKWKILYRENLSKKSNKMKYLYFFTFPFKIFCKRKEYDKIIAWQQFYGLIFAFYCKLFKVKKCNLLYVMTFIYKERKGVKGKLYYNFLKYIINSIYIDKIICFSKYESEYYTKLFKADRSKFIYTQLGIEIINKDSDTENKDYFLSVGRSNRDYDFLVDSLKNTNYKLKILSDYYIKNNNNKNIEIYNNVFHEEYYKMLKECKGVIISLKDENISSGQLVLLQAMQFKKPVIITQNKTITDYIKNGYSAIIINKTKNDLISALKEITENKEYVDKITENAYSEYNKKFTIQLMAERIGNIINNDGVIK